MTQSDLVSDKIIEFIKRHIKVPEGAKVGEPMDLAPFQVEFIRDVYDNPAKTRRAILSMARKNGKTALIAALLLAHLCSTALRRPNASIVSAAATRDQAALVFDLAVKMIQLNPALATVTRIIPSSKTIIGLKANTTYKALSADAQSAHGLSPSVLISDEAGQIVGPSNKFIDALITSQGAHENPLQIFISTQAANDADLFSTLIDDAIKSDDAKTVVHVYRADDDCDLMDREQWKKANPGLGLFRSEEDLAEQLQQASRLPSMEAMSRNLLLNCRISLERQAFAPKIVADNNSESDWQVFRDYPVYAGLDLSRVNDLTAMCIAADDGEHIHLKTLAFTPMGGIRERANRDRVPYDVWADQDLLYAPPGDTLDYEMICEWLTMLMEEQGVEISGVYFDRWRAKEFFKAADEKGFATLAHREGVGQGYQSMSPRLEAFETALLQKRLKMDNHPVLNMGLAAAIAVTDPSGNRKLSKPKEHGPKIDAVVAALMAVYPCVHKPEEMGSDLSFWVA